MVKWDGLSGRAYLEPDERLTPAPPSLQKAYPGLTFFLKRVPALAEKGAKV